MGAVIVTESTLRDFVEDAERFNAAMDARFLLNDDHRHGRIPRSQLLISAFEAAALPASSRSAQEEKQQAADYPKSADAEEMGGGGMMNAAEFKSQMREMLLAMADGLRGCPLQMLVEKGSILADAVKHEESRASKRTLQSSSSFQEHFD